MVVGDEIMGARVISDGMTDWILEISKLRKGSKEIIEKALKAGADVMADGFRSEINDIPTDERYVKDGEMKSGIRQIQKKGLLDSFGITPIREEDGVYDVHLGWDGYNELRTKAWPQGQPNKMIARSVNSGTSYMTAYPFINRSKSKYQKDAEKAMEETIAEEIGKITE